MSTTEPRSPALQDDPDSHLAGLSAGRLRQLIRLSHAFNSTLDLDELLPRILELASETVESEAGSIWIVENEMLICRAAVGPASDMVTGIELPMGVGIVGDTVATGQPVLLQDAPSDPRFLHQIDEATGYQTRSLLAVPLIADGETVGAIQVLNDLSGAFDEEDVHFLVALADDAAAALRNARLYEAERRARDLKALLEFSHEVTSTLDMDRVALSIVNLAGRAIGFDRCVLALWEADALQVRAIAGETEVDRKSAAVKELERFLLWASEHENVIRVADLTDNSDPDAQRIVERFAGYLESNHVGALLVLQLHDAEGKLGMLLFEFSRAREFTEWQVEALQILANEATLALRNAQLYADVPFISWLEPLREKRRALASLPAASWLRYGVIALVVGLVLTLVRVPMPIGAQESGVRSAVQRAARSPVNGVVEAVYVREGEQVARGAVLARVRDDDLARQLAQARGALSVAQREALAEEARGDHAAASIARASIAELQQLVALLDARLAESTITAPEAGRVLTPRTEDLVGSFAAAGTPVVWLGEPDWAEVELLVRQQDVGQIREGDRVRARVTAHPGVVFTGQVASISPAALEAGDGPVFAVRAVLDNREGLLLPGMAARARIWTQSRPLGAVIMRRPLRWLNMNLWW